MTSKDAVQVRADLVRLSGSQSVALSAPCLEESGSLRGVTYALSALNILFQKAQKRRYCDSWDEFLPCAYGIVLFRGEGRYYKIYRAGVVGSKRLCRCVGLPVEQPITHFLFQT